MRCRCSTPSTPSCVLCSNTVPLLNQNLFPQSGGCTFFFNSPRRPRYLRTNGKPHTINNGTGGGVGRTRLHRARARGRGRARRNLVSPRKRFRLDGDAHCAHRRSFVQKPNTERWRTPCSGSKSLTRPDIIFAKLRSKSYKYTGIISASRSTRVHTFYRTFRTFGF